MAKRNRKNFHRQQTVSPRLPQRAEVPVTGGTLLDIVIPVLGCFDLLEKCLAAIPAAVGDFSYRVIVFDNGSNKSDADGYYANSPALEALGNNARVIRNEKNVGFPVGCNMAVQRGKSPLVLLLNSDVILGEKSVDLLVRAMDDPKVGVVGMKLLFPTATECAAAKVQSDNNNRPAGKVQHVGLSTNIRGEFYHHFLGWSSGHYRVNRVRTVLAVTGAALLTRRTLWKHIGGFDPMYGFGTYEDVDYCIAAQQAGTQVIVETKAVGTHYTGATAERAQIRYPLNINHQKLLAKYTGQIPWTEWEVL